MTESNHNDPDSQILFEERVATTSRENPELPTDFVRTLLIARKEDLALATPFSPEGIRKQD